MPLALYTCLLWLSTSGLWTIQAEDPDAVISTKSPHRDLAPINADFAFNLYKHLVASAPDQNTFISPVSISMALAMLSLGAGGHTRTQLLQGLGFNLTETSESEIHQRFQRLYHLLRDSDTGLEMTMSSTLTLDRNVNLLDSFLEDIRHYYGSEALTMDFQELAETGRQIDAFIKNTTQGEPADLFSDPDSPAIPTMVNYIFSKGTWTHPFDLERTTEQNFYVNERTTVKVPMMFYSGSVKYLLDPELPCQVVQLDHMGNQTIFLILPDPGQIDTVTAALSRDTMDRWSTSLAMRQVNLYIPKVSISETYDLGSVLADMGIEDLFTNQANFSGISHAKLKVSNVIHKATLQLDEEGVKPAAIRELGGIRGIKRIRRVWEPAPKPTIVNFNRPFSITIFDHFTWSSILLGKVVNLA